VPSILDRCAGGGLLDKPVPVEAPPEGTVEELKARILADLLPAQRDFVLDEKHRILAYIGGFGSGKSFALTAKCLFLAMAPGNENTTGMVCEPSFPMLRTVFFPAMDEALERWGIEYEFRASPQPEYLLTLPNGKCKILCQSATNYQKIRGQNLSWACWDECDTLPVEIAQKASEMMLARLRSGGTQQLAVASTPEGFAWAFRTFKETPGPDKRLIRVRTMDNPNLPKEFIESLKRNYSGPLIQSYLEGHFVNLASCALYPDFDRSLHYTDALPEEHETIFVGIDINVGNSVTQHCVKRGDTFHFFAEAVYRDTQQIAEGLKELYPLHFERGQLTLIPDAAAKQRSTAAAQESDISILKKAGHHVISQQSNPLIQDRINAVNACLTQGRLLVGNGCKHLRRTLEQHSYDDKGKPTKGGVGMDDLSHAGDSMGYCVYRLAALRQWKTGGTSWRVY
jgi:PBSX family phage terminase large subunit